MKLNDKADTQRLKISKIRKQRKLEKLGTILPLHKHVFNQISLQWMPSTVLLVTFVEVQVRWFIFLRLSSTHLKPGLNYSSILFCDYNEPLELLRREQARVLGRALKIVAAMRPGCERLL